jgi:peptide chain release factor subunit 1
VISSFCDKFSKVPSKTTMNDQEIEQWRMKKLFKSLSDMQGNGTSVISLIIPPGDQIYRVTKMLNVEYGTAENIKSRITRQSVQGAITSAIQKLKLYSKTPRNGLIVYCGLVLTIDGKEKMVSIDFEPFKPF